MEIKNTVEEKVLVEFLVSRHIPSMRTFQQGEVVLMKRKIAEVLDMQGYVKVIAQGNGLKKIEEEDSEYTPILKAKDKEG